jgi:hypothetical protein
MVFEGKPDEILLNDGTVPETTGTSHSRKVVMHEEAPNTPAPNL